MKKVLRANARNILSTISEDERFIRSKKISFFLKDLVESANLIGGFVPFQKEPFWQIEIMDLEKKFCFPVEHENKMAFSRGSFNELELKNVFGVQMLVPKTLDIVIPDLLIIPALLYSEDGKRLGRGKGYYDRYLKNYRGLKIGVCFKEQIFNKVEVDENDEKVDYVVTDDSVHRCL